MILCWPSTSGEKEKKSIFRISLHDFSFIGIHTHNNKVSLFLVLIVNIYYLLLQRNHNELNEIKLYICIDDEIIIDKNVFFEIIFNNEMFINAFLFLKSIDYVV